MATMQDIFSGDAFSSVTLTALVNENYPYVPNFLTGLNLAPAEGMLTLDAAFDDVTGGIRMISATPRGAPPSQSAVELARTRKLPSVHLSREAEVNADELLAARAFGTMDPVTLQGLILRRTDGPSGLKVQLMLTMEHMLLGAIDGVVYDADNATILYDFYGWSGTARPAAAVIPFAGMTADTGVLKAFGLKLRRAMVRALNGMPIGAARPYVLCGDDFYDRVATCAEVNKAAQGGAFGNPAAAALIQSHAPV